MTNTDTALVTQHLALKLDEATFSQLLTNVIAEAARVMAREMKAGKSVADAAGVLHGELMEFDASGMTALLVRENFDSLVDFMLA